MSFSIAFVAVAGVVNTEGALWKDQRKFVHDNLKKFGMNFRNSRNMESKIMVSIKIKLISL